MKKNIRFGSVSIEEVKKYWDKYPSNIGHSKAKIGSCQFFDQLEKRKYLDEPFIPKFAEFEKWKGKKVLEIGSGAGKDTITFAKMGAQVTAVDISQKSLDIAIQRAKVYGLEDKIKFYCGNTEELTKFVPVEPYDLIYSFGAIHHSPRPEKIIEQMHYYTHPGTVIKIMIYHRYSWQIFWILFKYGKGAFWKLDELITKYNEAGNCPVIYTYSKKETCELLKGFKIIDVSTHVFTSKIRHFIPNPFKKFFPDFSIPKSIHRWFENHFGWNICITAIVR